MKNKKIISLFITLALPIIAFNNVANDMNSPAETALLENKQISLRVATFNVSMEALNYLSKDQKTPTGNELQQALNSGHQQIKNIAEIIQKVKPDIILLNEFDYLADNYNSLSIFINDYLAKSQNNENAIEYPYFYQAPVNTGVISEYDFNQNNKSGESPADTYGFGYFPGHFGMALLSKHPIAIDDIRTFQLFRWKDMPNAMKPIQPDTLLPFYNEQAWENFRLSSKSHWDVPISVQGTTIHILASHPTPPVFDGPEDRNGKRNHDEIRFWNDYITPNKSNYIYDDKHRYGGLKLDSRFIILGDLNASATEGDAINSGITALLEHKKVTDPTPESLGGKNNNPNNIHAAHHTAYWGMRADYVLPSASGFSVIDSGVFWPINTDDNFRLIKDRQSSSDHRLVWVDLKITK